MIHKSYFCVIVCQNSCFCVPFVLLLQDDMQWIFKCENFVFTWVYGVLGCGVAFITRNCVWLSLRRSEADDVSLSLSGSSGSNFAIAQCECVMYVTKGRLYRADYTQDKFKITKVHRSLSEFTMQSITPIYLLHIWIITLSGGANAHRRTLLSLNWKSMRWEYPVIVRGYRLPKLMCYLKWLVFSM